MFCNKNHRLSFKLILETQPVVFLYACLVPIAIDMLSTARSKETTDSDGNS